MISGPHRYRLQDIISDFDSTDFGFIKVIQPVYETAADVIE